MRRLLALAIFIAVINQIQPSWAQEGPIEKWADHTFGREKLSPLNTLKIEDLQKQADAVAPDMRFIGSYLALVQAFKSSSVVQELRPRFDESVSRVASTFVKTMDTLEKIGLLTEVSKFQNELPKLMSDPKMAAEYLLWEADVVAPYGISPARSLASVRVERPLKYDEIKKAREVAISLGEKVKSMSGEEITSRVDGLAQVITGIGIAIGDFYAFRRGPVRAFISFGAAVNEVVEGGSKLFG